MLNKEITPLKITGIGKYLPDSIVKNNDIAKIVDTNDEWIVSRTGIKERRVVSGNETASFLASKAALDALGYAGVAPEEIDLIITATSLPDNFYPSTSCEVQSAIGANKAVGFDIVAACSGLIFALNVARSLMITGSYKKALIIGVDVHSRFLDWTDRSTCILFGDGAGALVLEKSDDGINDILSIDIHSDGTKSSELKIPVNGVNCPLVEPASKKNPL